jgi:hypothetical protein
MTCAAAQAARGPVLGIHSPDVAAVLRKVVAHAA